MKLWVRYCGNNSVRFDGKTFQVDTKDILQVSGKDVNTDVGNLAIGCNVRIKGGSKKRSRIWNGVIVAEPGSSDGRLLEQEPSTSSDGLLLEQEPSTSSDGRLLEQERSTSSASDGLLLEQKPSTSRSSDGRLLEQEPPTLSDGRLLKQETLSPVHVGKPKLKSCIVKKKKGEYEYTNCLSGCMTSSAIIASRL